MANLEMGDIPNNEKSPEDVTATEKIKFANGSSGDIEKNTDFEKKELKNHFAGLTKQELLQYADDPFWVKLRSALLLLFWVVWFGMLGSAILIIILSPKCPTRPETSILNGAAIYKVDGKFAKNYPHDLEAISKDFSYIKDQVKSKVILVDRKLINEAKLGTIKSFVKKAHKNELKVIVEIDSQNISVKVVENLFAIKVDGIKFSGKPTTAMFTVFNETMYLENKFNALIIADRKIGLSKSKLDMEIVLPTKDIKDKDDNQLNIGGYISLDKGDKNKMKAEMMIQMTQSFTPFINAGQEFGLDEMSWSKLQSQKAIGAGVTEFELFARLNSIREEDTMKFGVTEIVQQNSSKAICFTRKMTGFPTYYIAVNMESAPATVRFPGSVVHGEVVANTGGVNAELAVHQTFEFGGIYLKQNQGVVIRKLKDLKA